MEADSGEGDPMPDESFEPARARMVSRVIEKSQKVPMSGEATKGLRRIPRRHQPKKDAGGRDSARGVVYGR